MKNEETPQDQLKADINDKIQQCLSEHFGPGKYSIENTATSLTKLFKEISAAKLSEKEARIANLESKIETLYKESDMAFESLLKADKKYTTLKQKADVLEKALIVLRNESHDISETGIDFGIESLNVAIDQAKEAIRNYQSEK